MELTPELLDEQEFPVVLRGYDTASVDDFLERVGAGLGMLLGRLDQAGTRMAEMEAELAQRPAVGGPAAADDFQGQVDQVSRALVLAQEAADKTTAEARMEADRLLAEARTTADGLVAQADADVEARISTAEAEVESRAAALRAVRDRELADLAARQQATEAEIVALTAKLDEQRRQLKAVAAAAQAVLDDSAPSADRGPLPPPEQTVEPDPEETVEPDVAAEVVVADDGVVPTAAPGDGGPVAPDPVTEAIPTMAPADHDDGGPVPADQSMFWRAAEANGGAGTSGSGLFDQDDEDVAPAAPMLRAVEPPDDDPFLAALRGDDDAAAALAHRPVDDEEPSGLMRRLRRG